MHKSSYLDVAGNRQDCLTPGVDGVSSNPDVRRQFRSPAEIESAARSIPATMPRWEGQQGERWQLTVMGGGIQLGTKDFGRLAISLEARIQRALSEDVHVTLTDQQRPGKRGTVVSFSQKSRARMVRTLCAIDYSKIVGDGCTPGLVTLTMPHDWESVAPTPQHFKKMVNTFRKRYESAWGHAMPGIWKMETQFRKACHSNGCHDPRAPHLHILTDVPQGAAPRPLPLSEASHLRGCHRDDCAHDAHFRADMLFPEWLSHAWALSVNHPDEHEFAKHLAAGTNVSYEETLRYGDAKRIAVYFTKHGTFANKDYQNELPQLWRDAMENDAAGGANFWGRWVVPVVRATQEVDASLIMHIARHLRHVQRSANYVRATEVWRLNTRTGEYRKRKVRRRVKYMRGHRGFLSMNDGVAAAADIARLIDYHTRDWFDVSVEEHGGWRDLRVSELNKSSSGLDSLERHRELHRARAHA